MFTGLINTLGYVQYVSPLGTGLTVEIEASQSFIEDIQIGDSINVNGVCSTAIDTAQTSFSVQYLEETLKKTTMGELKQGDCVNLEPCLTLQTKLGGHLVSGHVDDTGCIKSISFDGDWAVIEVAYNSKFAPFLIQKGSIAIDGISLTVVDLSNERFTCHLIPHTQNHTNLHKKTDGDRVNLEFDQVGKYLHRFLNYNRIESN